MRRLAIFALSICMVIGSAVFVGAQNITSLFDLGMGVRPWGMGGAFVGLADDENALLYNPAALAYLDRARFGALFERRFGIVNDGSVAFAAQNLGLGLLFLNISNIPQQETREPTGSFFSYSNLAAIASLGLPISAILSGLLPGDLALGLSLKFLRVNTLQEGQGTGLAFQPSVLLQLAALQVAGILIDRIRVGMLLENLLGLGITYGSGHSEGWRMGIRVGASATIGEGLTVALDLDTGGTFYVGSEIGLRGLGLELEALGGGGLVLRFGALLGKQFAPTLGFSLSFNAMRIDYAFITHSLLPWSHRLAFSMAFEMPPLLPFLGPTPEDPCDDPVEAPPPDPCDDP